MSLIVFIVILISLILVHELGHFAAAKFFGIRVDEFAIGFPPRLFRVRYGETEYTFNLLLVGGYVRIHGEDPSFAKATEGTARDNRSFANKPRLVQAAVLVAGVTMNLMVGWLALSGGYMAGMAAVPGTSAFGEVRDVRATVTQVLPESPAEKVGLMAGDKIEALQTGAQKFEPPLTAENITRFIAVHQDESFVITVSRGSDEKGFIANPGDCTT